MYRVTLTSKNQITIPAKLVRELHLDKTRKLRIEKRGKSVSIVPEPSLENQFDALWAGLAPKVTPVSNAQLKKAKRLAWQQAAERKLVTGQQ